MINGNTYGPMQLKQTTRLRQKIEPEGSPAMPLVSGQEVRGSIPAIGGPTNKKWDFFSSFKFPMWGVVPSRLLHGSYMGQKIIIKSKNIRLFSTSRGINKRVSVGCLFYPI